jgi:hypothetical protein
MSGALSPARRLCMMDYAQFFGPPPQNEFH